MAVRRIPAGCGEGTPGGLNDATANDYGVRMRAYRRHHATVVAIEGDIDAANGGRVQDFTTRAAVAGNALALDLSGVDFFAARGISVLIAVDDACRITDVSWALIPSRVVSRVLQLTACDTIVPMAGSIPEALREVTALTRARRRPAPVTTTVKRHPK